MAILRISIFLLSLSILGCHSSGSFQDSIDLSASSTHNKITGETSESSRDRWDSFFDQPRYVYGKKPSPFLVEVIHQLPVGRALVLAMGEGRDAVYLAQKGFEVEGIDISEVALRKARHLARDNNVQIKTINASLKSYEFPTEAYDVIVNFVYFREGIVPKIKNALKPGGVAVFQNYTTQHRNDQNGGFGIPDQFLVRPGQLQKIFNDFDTIVYREDLERRTQNGPSIHMASLLSRKKPQ